MTEQKLPALTEAEKAAVHHYLAIVDLLARINPARAQRSVATYSWVLAAQSLVSTSQALLDAVETMADRGEDEIHVGTISRAMRLLDGERRAARLLLGPLDGGEPRH